MFDKVSVPIAAKPRVSNPWRPGEVQAAFDRAVREEADPGAVGEESVMRLELLIGVVVCAAGCVAGRPYPAPDLPGNAQTMPTTGPATLTRPTRKALVLSGGGAHGAFAVGFLNGWSEVGTRPEFDVVTGVSTGALIAPFAFLGPAYDDRLKGIYMTTRDGDVYRRRPLAMIPWVDSLANPAPLRKRIAAEATDDFLDRVAAEHRKGRRLYVATTDLDTKRQVVWDLGAIAASGGPDRQRLFCDVILASCSVPGVFPPVPIDVEIDGKRHTELHVDGGVSANAFLPASALGVDGTGAVASRGDRCEVYVIISNQLSPARTVVTRRLLPVSEEALSGVLAAQLRDDLLKLYLLCRYTDAGYHMAAIPDDVPVEGNTLVFDAAKMGRLHSAGREAGLKGLWAKVPPGLAPNEQPIPREGRQLKVVIRVPAGVQE